MRGDVVQWSFSPGRSQWTTLREILNDASDRSGPIVLLAAIAPFVDKLAVHDKPGATAKLMAH